MQHRSLIRSIVLLVVIIAIAVSLGVWKYTSIQHANATFANQPEPMETVTVAVVKEVEHRPTTTSIGTVLALRSVTLRNELPGTVQQVNLTPGQVVEAGTVLVKLDVSVEEAELKAQQAQVVLAKSVFTRTQRLHQDNVVSEEELDRALAERDVALAQITRIQAIIERKTIRAPFRARVGLADVHPGQYLEQGTQLTTLQGIDEAVHVDFQVAQQVAYGLRAGIEVNIFTSDFSSITARIVAIDARIDPSTRNAMVRARIEDASAAPAPGASVRVQIPVKPQTMALAIPVSALRKGPQGSFVFVITEDENGNHRAQHRPVESGEMLGDEVIIHKGLSAGEQVAASGSFKLNDGTLVVISNDSERVTS